VDHCDGDAAASPEKRKTGGPARLTTIIALR
jgi:hypothetical protein